MAGPIHGGAADDDNVGIADRLDDDVVARLEHQEPFRSVAVAGDLDLAGDDVNGAFFMLGIERKDGAGFEMRLGEHRVPTRYDRRAQPVHRSRDDPQMQAILPEFGNVGRRSMSETRRGLFVFRR